MSDHPNWRRRGAPAVAAALLAACTLSACQKSADETLRLPPPSEAARLRVAPGPSRVGDMFWLNEVTLGCILPAGNFMVMKFKKGVAEIETSRGKGTARAEFLPPKQDFVLVGDRSSMDFKYVQPKTAEEAHILRFKSSGKDVTCFTWVGGLYAPNDGFHPQLESLLGQWTCAGEVGTIAFDSQGRFRRQGQSGHIVVSAPGRDLGKARLYLLGGVTGSGMLTSIVPMEASFVGLEQGQMKLGGQQCKKS